MIGLRSCIHPNILALFRYYDQSMEPKLSERNQCSATTCFKVSLSELVGADRHMTALLRRIDARS